MHNKINNYVQIEVSLRFPREEENACQFVVHLITDLHYTQDQSWAVRWAVRLQYINWKGQIHYLIIFKHLKSHHK